MAENTYTITAKAAAENQELWAQVARGEVEVTDSDGDTVLKLLKKKTERGNTVYEPFTIAMDTDGERNECPVLYHSDEVLTVTRLQPPADTLTELRNRHVDIIDFYRKELQQIGSALGIDGVFADDYGTATMFNAVAILQAANAQLAARAARAEAALEQVVRERYVNFGRSDAEIVDALQVIIRQMKVAGMTALAALREPLADGDAQTEDGG